MKLAESMLVALVFVNCFHLPILTFWFCLRIQKDRTSLECRLLRISEMLNPILSGLETARGLLVKWVHQLDKAVAIYVSVSTEISLSQSINFI